MLVACAAQAQTTNAKSWNSQTAAAYLDGRKYADVLTIRLSEHLT